MYALEAKAAIFRRARRLLSALAAILIPASVLSCQVCHAFGREVENSNPIREILYSPVGKVAIMNGATTVSASFLPVPGGSSVNQTGGSVLIRHLNLQGTASVGQPAIRAARTRRGVGGGVALVRRKCSFGNCGLGNRPASPEWHNFGHRVHPFSRQIKIAALDSVVKLFSSASWSVRYFKKKAIKVPSDVTRASTPDCRTGGLLHFSARR